MSHIKAKTSFFVKKIRILDKRENDVVLLNESGEFNFEGVDCGEFGVVGMNDGKLTVGAFGEIGRAHV